MSHAGASGDQLVHMVPQASLGSDDSAGKLSRLEAASRLQPPAGTFHLGHPLIEVSHRVPELLGCVLAAAQPASHLSHAGPELLQLPALRPACDRPGPSLGCCTCSWMAWTSASTLRSRLSRDGWRRACIEHWLTESSRPVSTCLARVQVDLEQGDLAWRERCSVVASCLDLATVPLSCWSRTAWLATWRRRASARLGARPSPRPRSLSRIGRGGAGGTRGLQRNQPLLQHGQLSSVMRGRASAWRCGRGSAPQPVTRRSSSLSAHALPAVCCPQLPFLRPQTAPWAPPCPIGGPTPSSAPPSMPLSMAADSRVEVIPIGVPRPGGPRDHSLQVPLEAVHATLDEGQLPAAAAPASHTQALQPAPSRRFSSRASFLRHEALVQPLVGRLALSHC